MITCGENSSVRDEAIASSSGTLAHEIQIGADGKACRRQHALEGDNVFALEAEAFAKTQPALDAALAIGAAIMVDEALAPGPPQGGVVEACDQAGVLARDRRLIGIAIEGPGLNLALAAGARMQALMEGVPVMVARCADGTQAVQKGLGGQQAHSRISSPSWAISTPALSTSLRSREPSIRTGFELLIWV